MQQYAAGKGISDISKQEKRNRETVSKIVHGPEMQEHVRALRERWFGLGHVAVDAVRHALTEEKDGRLGFQVAESMGVVPSPAERQSMIASLAILETDEETEVKKIAANLLIGAIERHAYFGMPLPELEKDLEQEGGRINYETGKVELIEKKTTK